MIQKIQIMIVDDHEIVAEGTAAILGTILDFEVAAVHTAGREALATLAILPIDVVITDITMMELNGIDLTKSIKRDWPAVHVVALSIHSEGAFVKEMFRAGAGAYLHKDCMKDELEAAVRRVVSGGLYVSTTVARHFPKARSPVDAPVVEFENLSARERQVLQLIACGKSSREIADALYISIKTIETHRAHISEKLDIHGIADLTRFAIREGLVTL